MGSRLKVPAGAGRALTVLTWALVAFACLAAVALPSPGRSRVSAGLLLLMMSAFFVTVLLRLLLVAVRQPERRFSVLTLAGSVCLWAMGSVALASNGSIDTVTFPAPGEWLFVSAYGGMAAFLQMDAHRRRGRPLTIWVETLVVCGGAASIAGFGLLVPAAITAGAGGVPVVLAYLYPTLTLILSVLVLAQVLLHQRGLSLRTATLVAGFVALSLAETSVVYSLSSGTYVSSWPLSVLYAVGLGLLVTAASTPNDTDVVYAPGRVNVGLLVGAATIAVMVLTVVPRGDAAWYVVVPALITVCAVGARLVLALREAQDAAHARTLSLTDELTGLPNRRAILAELDVAVRHGSPLALLLLDLDGFKDVNDSLGHAAGDDVLVVVAQRMQGLASSRVLPARLGGDEFAVIVRDDDHLRLVELAQRVRALLLEPIVVDRLELATPASVGIAVRDQPGTTSTELLRRADVAMYDAKVSRAGVLVYESSRDGFTRQRLRLAEDLRKGIAEGQLSLWYQPQLDALTRRPVALEALVRWEHPEHGLLQPLAFLPQARRSGLMLALTEAVMHGAVTDAQRWLAQGHQVRVAFNCAPPELLGGVLLPKLFEAAAGLPPETLMVEVTEDSFLSDPDGAREALTQLRNHHVQIAIDDYGTGFSSLSYLRDLPVQELKIDRSFVSTILEDERSHVIVDSTQRMAAAMGLRVVAEGVEDEATAIELGDLGVHVVQGYHFARPMPAAEVSAWLQKHSVPQQVVR